MNSKQLKAHRRRARQKLKKAAQSSPTPDTPQSQTAHTLSTQSLLNKLVGFDHFALDSTGFLLKPVRGIIIKCALDDDEEVLTIKIMAQDPSSVRTNKRIEALMPSQAQDTITASISSLLNFKVLN